jgi:hypothetical protein
VLAGMAFVFRGRSARNAYGRTEHQITKQTETSSQCRSGLSTFLR